MTRILEPRIDACHLNKECANWQCHVKSKICAKSWTLIATKCHCTMPSCLLAGLLATKPHLIKFGPYATLLQSASNHSTHFWLIALCTGTEAHSLSLRPILVESFSPVSHSEHECYFFVQVETSLDSCINKVSFFELWSNTFCASGRVIWIAKLCRLLAGDHGCRNIFSSTLRKLKFFFQHY